MKGPSTHKGTKSHTKQLRGKYEQELALNKSMDSTSLPDGRPGSSLASSPNKILGAVVGAVAKKALGGIAKKAIGGVAKKVAGSAIGQKVKNSKVGKAYQKHFGGGDESDSPADYKSPAKMKDDKNNIPKDKQKEQKPKPAKYTHKQTVKATKKELERIAARKGSKKKDTAAKPTDEEMEKYSDLEKHDDDRPTQKPAVKTKARD